MTLPLVFEHVGKRFGDTVVLKDVHFRSEPGELIVLVGPSGCGKSTLMRLVAGLETLSEGRIFAGDREISTLLPHERGVGMVFQSYALYPHMTVRDNLAFPLAVQKRPAAEIAKEVTRVAEMLSLTPLLERLPKQLSGGQRQRVAIGRCLVRKPDIYCFDEPLSNLDAALRSQIRVELKTLQRELSRTTIYVTHDQVEAMTMADRIVVLHQGVVQQVGTPKQLYNEPQNCFVARFIGSPSMSLISGVVRGGRFESGSLDCALDVPDGSVILGVRAEDVVVSEQGKHRGTVRSVEPVGEIGHVHLEVSGMTALSSITATDTPRQSFLVASLPGHAAFALEVGAELAFDLAAAHLHAFDEKTQERIGPRAAER